jgi:quinol monooxygenase YgiN
MDAKRSNNANLTVVLTAQPAKQAELQQALEGLGRNMAAAPGCLQCVVASELAGPRFIIFLAFTDQRSLDAQLVSETFRILRGATDLLSEPAELRVVAADAALGFIP